MYFTVRCFAATMTGIAALKASAASRARSLLTPDPNRIKQMLAQEIAHRLVMTAAQIPLSAISPAKLHTPFPLVRIAVGWARITTAPGSAGATPSRRAPGPRPCGLRHPPPSPLRLWAICLQAARHSGQRRSNAHTRAWRWSWALTTPIPWP